MDKMDQPASYFFTIYLELNSDELKNACELMNVAGSNNDVLDKITVRASARTRRQSNQWEQIGSGCWVRMVIGPCDMHHSYRLLTC
jgi:hypothetical protein